jgi:ABC-2 type transport system ATP-binding protein
MPIITVENAQKTYRVANRVPGFFASMRHFFKRTYKHVAAVKPVSFSIEPGEVVGFLGPNGAGKTTTLKMLTGLIHPSGGKLDVAGYVPFQRKSDFLRRIGLVMGNKQQLIWDLPASESFRINAAVYDIPEAVAQQRVAELSTMLAVADKLNVPVRKLSLGERMKCELLAALLHEPQILFLDEPTLGLDVNAQVAVRDFLRAYNARTKATILLTSHYMGDITALCERVLLIHQGTLFYDGSLSGIVDRFAPYREVRIDLASPLTAAQLAGYGEVESIEGQSVKLLVRRDALTRTMERLLQEVPLLDLTIADPPIEKIIGQLFAAGNANQPSEAAAPTAHVTVPA